MKVLQEARQMIYGNVLILGTLVKQSRPHVPPRWAGRGQIGLCSAAAAGEINLDPSRHKKLQWQVQVATGLWLTSPPPSGGKLKTILRWRTDNFIQTLSYLQPNFTSVQAEEDRSANYIHLQFAYLFGLILTLARWVATCVLTPDQKAIGHPVDICTCYWLSAVDISLSMCGCQVSPLLSAAPLLCSVRSFALFQLRAVHSPPSQAAPPHQAAISLNKLSQFIGQQQQSSLWRNSQWDS